MEEALHGLASTHPNLPSSISESLFAFQPEGISTPRSSTALSPDSPHFLAHNDLNPAMGLRGYILTSGPEAPAQGSRGYCRDLNRTLEPEVRAVTAHISRSLSLPVLSQL